MQTIFRGILAALVLSFAFTMDAAAGPLRNLFAPRQTCRNGNCTQATTATATTTETVKVTATESKVVTVAAAPGPILESLAQMKANTQARLGRMFHPGGGFGAGTREGVGFSTVSAESAIRACCFWGVRTPIDIGVTRGARGWHAAVIYK